MVRQKVRTRFLLFKKSIGKEKVRTVFLLFKKKSKGKEKGKNSNLTFQKQITW